ncbi:MAG: DUF3786 domain-containing protein [Actinobacteria bacterium]|nr:MAG: DUF3786 domain-containing protein [Actinomycetota bacterium]
MDNYTEAIKTLLEDVKNISFKQAARRLKAKYNSSDDSLEVKMLQKKYHITRKGVFFDGKLTSGLVSLMLLNALLSPGDKAMDIAFKPYKSFFGTGGHVGYFAHAKEGFLAKNWQKVLQNQDDILSRLDGAQFSGETSADIALEFEPFANIKLACLIYKPDEEFGPSAKILFSANADKYMPAECLEELTRMLVREMVG